MSDERHEFILRILNECDKLQAEVECLQEQLETCRDIVADYQRRLNENLERR